MGPLTEGKRRGRPVKGSKLPIKADELTTHDGITAVLARLMDVFLADRLSEVKARSTITALRLALDVIRDKRDCRVEEKLAAIEKRLLALGVPE